MGINTVIDRTWNLLNVAVEQARENEPNILCNKEAEDKYKKIFLEKYNFIKDNFMKKSVSSLDRHKISSIAIACVIESDAVIYNEKIPENNRFFGKYMIAVSVALSYMLDRLNARLEKKGQNKIKEYWFPNAFSCKTPYFEIFSRNLYLTYEKTDWGLNLLDMSEILFLLEYMTLRENNIDPAILIEEDSK